MTWTEHVDDLVDQAGYLACGCHGSQTEHTCADWQQPVVEVDDVAAPWWDR